jgi:hypothetical protein
MRSGREGKREGLVQRDCPVLCSGIAGVCGSGSRTDEGAVLRY